MRSTYITATVVGLLVVLWLASGQLGDQPLPPAASIAEQNRTNALKAEEKPPVRVRVATSYASEQSRVLTIRGETLSKRTVEVKAQISGTLRQRLVDRGHRVKAGDVLCEISEEDRGVAVAEAKEAFQQAKIEYEGSQRLAREGLQSETLIAQSRARMAAARAQLTRAELAFGHLKITAPFDGVVEQRGLELGDYVTPGATCVTLVALDPMLLVGRVSEREVNQIKVGQRGSARLSSNEIVEGEVTFVGNVADEATRTYAVELEIGNPDLSIESGLTAKISVPVQFLLAHKISPALLSLDDRGNIGVRTVNNDNEVEFYLVEILRDAEDGIWVTGLPRVTTLITVGQELVVGGETVDPVADATANLDGTEPVEESTAQTANTGGKST